MLTSNKKTAVLQNIFVDVFGHSNVMLSLICSSTENVIRVVTND